MPIPVCNILRGLASLEKPSEVIQTVMARSGVACCNPKRAKEYASNAPIVICKAGAIDSITLLVESVIDQCSALLFLGTEFT
jgi:hypothetical protein